MSKAKFLEIVSNIDFSSPDLSLEKVTANLDSFLSEYKIEGEERDLFKSMLLFLCCASSVKHEVIKMLKASDKSADLSSALLVDIDTRYELLLAHSERLFSDRNIHTEFDLNLRSGARLSEEFFSDLVYRVSKLQRTLVTELGISTPALNKATISNLIMNINKVNTYLSELLGKLPGRYDTLAVGLLGV